jgi:membrane-associated phospholipid phosphatase
MSAPRWEWIAIGYYMYLLIVAWAGRRFVSARIGTSAGTAVCCVVLGGLSSPWLGLRMNALTFAILVPLPVLLGGYWLSGLFFVRPMHRVERWLMAIDERLLRRSGILAAYEVSPRVAHELLEMAYVVVYTVIPAAVATLAIGGHPDAIPRFWTIVLLAEFISYGMMPWLQTRPPRVLEAGVGMMHPQSALRRFNASILDRGSIQANTVPSGHAAGAVATGLAVADVMPLAGAVFLILAAGIVAATVLGRYHYLVDSLLGIVVAVTVWYFCR